MIILYILLGILLFFVLLLSFHIKIYLHLEDKLHLRVGLGPILLTIAPKKPPKPVDLRDYTYEKHQKRLEKDRKAALKKRQKAADKAESKKAQLAEKAEEAQKALNDVENAPAPVKLFTIFEIIEFVINELGKFASYMKTDVRSLTVIVGGKDPEKIAKTYGMLCAAVPLLLELMDEKTSMHKLRPNTVDLKADFTAEKIRFRVDFRFRLRLFSIVRIGWHALIWFIKAKIRQSQTAPIQ